MSKPSYGTESILKLDGIDHIKHNPGMYVGDCDDATKLAEECLDNSLDEVQAGYADKVAVFVDTKDKSFTIIDNGRGVPFDQSKPLNEDTPVLICNSLFTSGKFKKNDDSSAYGIAIGLHGVGLSAVFALSKTMVMEIYKDGLHATYNYIEGESITREQREFSGKTPFATKVQVKPDPKYFTNPMVNLSHIEERLRIACANFKDLTAILVVDGEKKIITGTEDSLILDYIGSDVDNWIRLDTERKLSKTKIESCEVRFGWSDQYNTIKSLTTINLNKAKDGAHVNLFLNMLKDFISKESKKRKYTFEINDCLVGLRFYINLKIIKASFSGQVKERLASQSDLTVMNELEKHLANYFKTNEDKLIELLDRFQNYRDSLKNKKLIKTSSKSRSSIKLNKLLDCSQEGGELFLGEGDSAGNGIKQFRDSKKHAILALRGVSKNVLKKSDFMKNQELKDIVVACGCGIGKECDISKLRYDKIIICADSDPAGKFITALLIIFFAYQMAPLIKAGKLYVCNTPLYGVRKKGVLQPLWTNADYKKSIDAGEHPLRFKGLGEFNPKDLAVFTLNESTRFLEQVEWSEKYHQKIFKLFMSPEERRKLVIGTWTLED